MAKVLLWVWLSLGFCFLVVVLPQSQYDTRSHGISETIPERQLQLTEHKIKRNQILTDTTRTEMLTNDMLSDIINELIPVMIQVESSGDDNAVGDGGKAVGCLQIWPIYVDDCNRILKKRWFNTADRVSRSKSISMTRTYLYHYGKAERVQPTSREDWMLKLAAMHNADPSGYLNLDTKYVKKIKRELDKE